MDYNESDGNVRTLAGMSLLIDRFENGDIPMHVFVPDLESLASALFCPQLEWTTAFEKAWLALEIDNAIALEKDQLRWYSECDAHIRDKIAELKRLTAAPRG